MPFSLTARALSVLAFVTHATSLPTNASPNLSAVEARSVTQRGSPQGWSATSPDDNLKGIHEPVVSPHGDTTTAFTHTIDNCKECYNITGDVPCSPEACHDHCRLQQHDTGLCEEAGCVCRAHELEDRGLFSFLFGRHAREEEKVVHEPTVPPHGDVSCSSEACQELCRLQHYDAGLCEERGCVCRAPELENRGFFDFLFGRRSREDEKVVINQNFVEFFVKKKTKNRGRPVYFSKSTTPKSLHSGGNSEVLIAPSILIEDLDSTSSSSAVPSSPSSAQDLSIQSTEIPGTTLSTLPVQSSTPIPSTTTSAPTLQNKSRLPHITSNTPSVQSAPSTGTPLSTRSFSALKSNPTALHTHTTVSHSTKSSTDAPIVLTSNITLLHSSTPATRLSSATLTTSRSSTAYATHNGLDSAASSERMTTHRDHRSDPDSLSTPSLTHSSLRDEDGIHKGALSYSSPTYSSIYSASKTTSKSPSGIVSKSTAGAASTGRTMPSSASSLISVSTHPVTAADSRSTNHDRSTVPSRNSKRSHRTSTVPTNLTAPDALSTSPSSSRKPNKTIIFSTSTRAFNISSTLMTSKLTDGEFPFITPSSDAERSHGTSSTLRTSPFLATLMRPVAQHANRGRSTLINLIDKGSSINPFTFSSSTSLESKERPSTTSILFTSNTLINATGSPIHHFTMSSVNTMASPTIPNLHKSNSSRFTHTTSGTPSSTKFVRRTSHSIKPSTPMPLSTSGIPTRISTPTYANTLSTLGNEATPDITNSLHTTNTKRTTTIRPLIRTMTSTVRSSTKISKYTTSTKRIPSKSQSTTSEPSYTMSSIPPTTSKKNKTTLSTPVMVYHTNARITKNTPMSTQNTGFNFSTRRTQTHTTQMHPKTSLRSKGSITDVMDTSSSVDSKGRRTSPHTTSSGVERSTGVPTVRHRSINLKEDHTPWLKTTQHSLVTPSTMRLSTSYIKTEAGYYMRSTAGFTTHQQIIENNNNMTKDDHLSSMNNTKKINIQLASTPDRTLDVPTFAEQTTAAVSTGEEKTDVEAKFKLQIPNIPLKKEPTSRKPTLKRATSKITLSEEKVKKLTSTEPISEGIFENSTQGPANEVHYGAKPATKLPAVDVPDSEVRITPERTISEIHLTELRPASTTHPSTSSHQSGSQTKTSTDEMDDTSKESTESTATHRMEKQSTISFAAPISTSHIQPQTASVSTAATIRTLKGYETISHTMVAVSRGTSAPRDLQQSPYSKSQSAAVSTSTEICTGDAYAEMKWPSDANYTGIHSVHRTEVKTCTTHTSSSTAMHFHSTEPNNSMHVTLSTKVKSTDRDSITAVNTSLIFGLPECTTIRKPLIRNGRA